MTQPHSPETEQQILKENPYGETVRGLIEDAPHFNINQLARLIEASLIKEISESAEKGELSSQYKDSETNELKTIIFSADDIFCGQIAAALEVQDAQPTQPKAWAENIPRANGLREALMTVMKDRRLAEPFRHAVYHKQAALLREKDQQAAPVQEIITGVPEALKIRSEELHSKAEEDLGEEAMEASGVELGAAAASRIVDIEQQEVQKDTYDYLRAALPPVVRPGSPQAAGREYNSPIDEEQQRKYYDKFVTEENRREAQSMLAAATGSTPEIRAILSAHNLPSSSVEAVDAIREDPDVRFEIAKLLVQKLDRLLLDDSNDMGWRINKNDRGNLKADPITGKKKQSRLYAVDMALKMLGGEFAERLEGRDDFARGPDGSISMGQHRHAARTVLMTHEK